MGELKELIDDLEQNRIVSKHETYYDRIPHGLVDKILAFLKAQLPKSVICHAYRIVHGTPRCWGTKECEECSCGGDETKCTFYPEKRR